jgi:hypothetical protein
LLFRDKVYIFAELINRKNYE